MYSILPLFTSRWLVMSQGGDFIIIGCGVFQTPHLLVLGGSKDEGVGTTFGSPEETLTEEICRPFVFCSNVIGRLDIRQHLQVVRLEWRVEAVKGAVGMCCLIVGLSGD